MDATTRRRFLHAGLAASLSGPLGCARSSAGRPALVPFVGEKDRAVGRVEGSGLDGRLALDLATLAPETLVTPADAFFIRTRFPEMLDPSRPWTIALGGLVARPKDVPLADLLPLAGPRGTHLMECSGNGAFCGFGLISAADWQGIPIAEVLKLVEPAAGASLVRVSGFDRYASPALSSEPGASWIFPRSELERCGAFLATGMNGRPLAPDHGRPVRLVVPGRYGCACIKWVDEISFVADDTPATGQMREFAARTHQDGEPSLARDFQPPAIDTAAMPVRVEAHREGGRLVCRVVGILWGGDRRVESLSILLGDDSAFAPVERLAHCSPASWSLWSHTWRPARGGPHAIRLRVDDPGIRTRRLDRGYYARTVDLDAV